MDLLSIFKGGKYFDKNIAPKCDYCQFGRRTKDGSKVLCEKSGLVEREYKCGRFVYSPLKRIPVKQLNFVGSLADEEIYIESAGDIAEKQEEQNAQNKSAAPAKAEEKPENTESTENTENPDDSPAETEATENVPETEDDTAPADSSEPEDSED